MFSGQFLCFTLFFSRSPQNPCGFDPIYYYPCIQILTIEELLHNAEVKMPPQFGTFKQAQRAQQADAEQFKLGFG